MILLKGGPVAVLDSTFRLYFFFNFGRTRGLTPGSVLSNHFCWAYWKLRIKLGLFMCKARALLAILLLYILTK